LALHQQAADQLGGDLLGGAGEEALGEGREVLDRRGGYGGGFWVDGGRVLSRNWSNNNTLYTESLPPKNMKGKLASIALKSKKLIQDINTFRLQSNILTSSDPAFKSVSDNGSYPELALRAALNPGIFSVFRRHRLYTPILEHVSKKQGEEYLAIIQEDYGYSTKEALVNEGLT
jgi:hypothetical protein